MRTLSKGKKLSNDEIQLITDSSDTDPQQGLINYI